MPPLFLDRVDAGRQLAHRLRHLAGQPDLMVLGLPRGGVPVAFEVATALGAPMDVLTVRKIGVPGHEELAMGAIATGGVRVENPEILSTLGISHRQFDEVVAVEERELERREQAFRKGRPFPDLRGAVVVLVDDGVATGSTMIAALRALRLHAPAVLVAAAPVMSEGALADLGRVADNCVTVATPEPFRGVGEWYRDFTQTSDADVLELLDRASTAAPAGKRTGNEVANASHS